jgi:CHAT domain-containing protein/Tfp pilus assembly protein PilF
VASLSASPALALETPRTDAPAESEHARHEWFHRLSRYSWALFLLFLLLMVPLRDSRPADAQSQYNTAWQSFLRGQLEVCQQEADLGYRLYQGRDPQWSSKFQLLDAEAMVWRGTYGDALHLLEPGSFKAENAADRVEELALQGVSLARLHQFPLADSKLAQAERICALTSYATCGGTIRARGLMALEQGQLSTARHYLLESLNFARSHDNRWLEANALVNLGAIAIQEEHYDEALDWSKSAYNSSLDLGNENRAQVALGNIGWAYFELGDSDRAMQLLLEAQQGARKLGNIRDEEKWLNTAGYVRQDMDDLRRAIDSYNQALVLARRINSKEDIIDSLELLAHLSIEMGNLDQADVYVQQLIPLVRATENRLDDLDVLLAQGKIAAARSQDSKAEADFRAVETDRDSQTSMRLGAEHELARLYERRGDMASADRMYKTALTTFEQARDQLQKLDSKLPFLANATPIYDDYVHSLVKQGKLQEALDVADHSRARTLAQGVGLPSSVQPVSLNVREIAQKSDATLLFYWLGRTQSYLWAVTPKKSELFNLPPRGEITPIVNRYRNALLGPDDPLETSNADGLALYRLLVAPAGDLVRPGSKIVILSDGALTQLNFETFIVPSPHPHYWIEDATLVSAPSLYMLASKKPSESAARNALLFGDAVSPDADYPELPKASVEMSRIEKHFAAGDEKIFARQMANPQAYMDSDPQQFAYIHFVAHGVASLTDPLDSAIILSRDSSADDSFKLYARDIIRRPIQARLVTISSCYGGGTRAYAGEGLVGLSWAFLRAGAHNVIGALWEVSDDSTPLLMDSLYQGLEQGLPPSVALRRAKLAMLHQQGSFHGPFFWAPFQIYTGL